MTKSELAEWTALRDGLEAAARLVKEALPKFDWGRSPLDANSIQLLNETPAKVRKALEALDQLEPKP